MISQAARRPESIGGFLAGAMGRLRNRRILVPALMLLLLLTFSNIVVLQNMPVKGTSPPMPFVIAGIVRVAGLLLIAVAILRTITASSRPRWLPDGGFWLYALTFVAASLTNAIVGRGLGDRTELPSLVIGNILVTLLLSPLVVWFVALAVEKPLAWRPGPWLRDLKLWWPQTILWTLLLITPMGVLHAAIDIRLIAGVGDLFWPLALFDGALSTAMALLGIGINAEAYRRVAEARASRLTPQA